MPPPRGHGCHWWTFFKSYSAKLLGHECRSARSLPAPKFVLGCAHGVAVRSRVSAWWPRVTSPSISAVAGDRLSLSHTRPSYLATSAAPLGVFPRPNSPWTRPRGYSQRPCFRLVVTGDVSPPISAVAGNRLSLSHTRPKLLGHECRSTRSLPAPKFLGRAPHGVTVQYWSRYPAWQQTENPARCAYLYFVVPIVLPPPSYSPVRPREGSVLAVAHGGAIRPFRTSPSRNRKTYR